MQQLVSRHPQYRVMLPSLSGFGDASTMQSIQQGAGIAVAAATGEIAAIAAGTSLVIPLIGPALAAVALGINLIMQSGCGQTCVVTSQWADQAESLLEQNIAAYFALPAPRSNQAKAVAVSGFQNIWAGLVSRCSQNGTGDAGVRCIQDRQRGACTWRQTSSSPLLAYPGEPQPGACWNWFSGYLDPIVNDPTVDASVSAGAPQSTSILSGSNSSMFLLGGAALLAIALMGGENR